MVLWRASGVLLYVCLTVFLSSAERAVSQNVTFGFSEAAYSVVEGEVVMVCVSLTQGTLDRNVTLTFSADGSSNADPGDYGGLDMQLEFFPDGVITGCIEISAVDDVFLEEDEVLVLILASDDAEVGFGPISNTTVSIITLTVALVDYPALSVQESAGMVPICVSLSPLATIDVTVNILAISVAAQGFSDYTPLNMNVTIRNGTGMQCVNISIIDDDSVEGNEIFNVMLSAVEPADLTVVNATVTVTISSDPNDTFTVALVDYPALSVQESAGMVPICVSLSPLATIDVTVNILAIPVAAQGSLDYTPLNMNVTINNGTGMQCVNISIIDDDSVEGDEMFIVMLSAVEPADVTVVNATVTVTISSDPNDTFTVALVDYPALSVQESAGMVPICVSLSPLASIDVTVNILAISVAAQRSLDYTSLNMNVTIRNGMGMQCVNISIIDDDSVEGDEIFNVMLSAVEPADVTVVNATVAVTIYSDPSDRLLIIVPPSLSVSEDVGVATVCVDVSTVEGLERDVLVTVDTSNDTAFAGVDYEGVSTTLTLVLGEQCVNITLLDDGVLEADEVFLVLVSSDDPAVTFAGGNVTRVTILAGGAVEVGFVMESYDVDEGQNVTVHVVVVDGMIGRQVTLNLSSAPADVGVIHPNQLVFAEGSVSEYFVLDVPLSVNLSMNTMLSLVLTTSEPGVTIGTNVTFVSIAVVRIGLEMMTYDVVEGGTQEVCVVLFTGTLQSDAVVTLTTQDDSAIASGDYTALTTNLTFGPNINRVCVNISTVDNGVLEATKVFHLALTTAEPDRVTLDPASAYVTIIENNTVTVGFMVSEVIVLEGDTATVSFGVLTGVLGTDIQVTARTQDGNATAGADYATLDEEFLLSNAFLTRNLSLVIFTDSTIPPEDFEVFSVQLSTNTSGVLLSPDTLTVMIIDPPVILVDPEDQFLLPGDTAVFQVQASGFNLSYQWLLDGMDIIAGVEGTLTKNLTISNVTQEDFGTYSCMVSNMVASVTSSEAELRLLSPPEKRGFTGDVGVLLGADITLNCSAVSSDGLVTITWSPQPAAPVVVTSDDGVTTSTLTLLAVTSDEEGEYTCTISNRFADDLWTLNVSVITIFGVSDVVVTTGNTATLFCSATGSPELTYSWGRAQNSTFTAEPFLSPMMDSRVVGADTNELTILAVSRDDAMEYGCKVSLLGNLIGTAFANLTTRGPEITMNPVSVTVTANDTLKLNCTAKNNADAVNGLSFAWVYKGSTVLLNATTMEFILDNLTTTSQLIIPQVSSEDAGKYRCLVTNHEFPTDEVGSEDAVVTVNFLPVVLVTVNSEAGPVVNLLNGTSGTLRCDVTAIPAPTLVEVLAVLGDESTMLSNISGDGSTGEEFTITPSLDQSGIVYECSATNIVGTGTGSVTVVVQDVPDMIDHTLISSTIVDILSVELSWVIPEDNNAPITYYNVSWCSLSSADTCIPETSSSRKLNMSRQTTGDTFRMELPFEPNAMFSLGIVAANSAGVGVAPVFDEEHMFSTATREQAAPTNQREVVLTNTAVVYEWTLPALARGDDIVLGQITFTVVPAGTTTNVLEVVVNTSLNAGAGLYGAALSGLTSGLLHNVSITAVFTNPDLTSTSLTFTFTPPAVEEALLPAAKVVIGTQNAESVSISWPGVTEDFLTGYEIDVTSTPRGVGGGLRRRRQSTPVTFNADPGATSTTIDTPPYSNVEATVFATFQPPGSPDGIRALLVPPVSFSSPEGRAGPPTGLRAESIGFTTVVFVWDSPSQPNGVITDHQIFFQKVDVMAGSRFLTDSASNMFPYPDSDLVANTEYTFTVTAFTNDGNNPGMVSNAARFRTRLGVTPPTFSLFQQSINIQLFDLVINLSQQYGNIRYFQVVVTTSNTIDTRTLGLDTSAISGAGYYVAFQGDFPTGVAPFSVAFTLGSGQSVPNNGTVFTNAVLNASTDYYVFVRAFSSVNNTLSNDSSYSQVIRFDIATPLNTVAIIVPIAAIAVLLLLVLIILLLFAYLTMRGTFRRKGYAPPSLLEDGKRRNKSGAAMELRRTRLFSPVLNVGSPDVFTSACQPTTLICEASGTPAPDVTWTHKDQPVDKERFIQLADGSLFINDTDLQDEGTYVVKAVNLAGEAEVAVRVTVLRPVPPEADPDHAPIKVGEFSEKIALVRAEDDEGLEDEYTDVELDWSFTSYSAKLNINKNKNRYINIIPYDHSRVVLSLQDNTPGSDYINASFVDAYQRPNGYIASQGPIPSTFPDFWRMIWELDSPTIVMVTNLKEEDKVKCHQYWPSYGTTTYGNIQVTLKEVENLAEYSIRTFNVSPLAGQSRVPMPVREVRQFHFLVWPDHGVPQYATNLLSFRKRVVNYHPEKRGPMVVHCSAGVGRTGTYITIDYMLKQMEVEGSINIFNFVRHMRYRRNYMVQTSPQYVFIHDALLEAIMCGDNSIKAPEMRSKVNELQDMLPETGKSLFQTQFDTLLTASPPDDDFDCSVAQVPDNMAKNRCKTHLPANDYRVVLSTDGEKCDYICASYVDNYRERNAFIVTQAPLEQTVADFWRMMWETKSAAIVMLTELVEDDQEMCVKYWPSGVGDPSVYGGYQVELSEDEKDRGSYITRRFKLSAINKPQESRMVSQFHFTNWTKTTPPTDCRPTIDLIDELQRVQRKSGNMPITVHCDDGLGRTGAFCALYSVLERVKTEQIVDVFQAVKTLRIQRTGLLGTIEEYQFVHRAVIEFLDTFSDYQNFK